MQITIDNYFICSFGNFQSCEQPAREPDFISKDKSHYWHEGDIVIRSSDHWGECMNCNWLLDGKRPKGDIRVGKININDFIFNSKAVALLVKRVKLLPKEIIQDIIKQLENI